MDKAPAVTTVLCPRCFGQGWKPHEGGFYHGMPVACHVCERTGRVEVNTEALR